jgi:P4 family phage/plasmid primase-like protien
MSVLDLDYFLEQFHGTNGRAGEAGEGQAGSPGQGAARVDPDPPPEPTEDDTDAGCSQDRTDPICIAQSFLKTQKYVFWGDEFLEWDGRKYVKRSRKHFKGQLRKHMQRVYNRARQFEDLGPRTKPRAYHVTNSKIGDAVSAVESEAGLGPEVHPPVWINSPREDVLSVANGIIDLGDWNESTGAYQVHDHTPDFYTMATLPVAYRPEAECPTVLKIVHEVTQGDGQEIQAIKEWFGYCLYPTLKAQVSMVFYGEGGTGKTTIATPLAALLGDENVSAVAFKTFNDQFSLSGTLGKFLNIVGDMNPRGARWRKGEMIDEAKLKQFIDGSKLQFEKKYKDAVFVHATAKLMMLTNELPHIEDPTNAMYSRLIIVPFRGRSYRGTSDENTNYADPAYWRNHEELPGILNWALEGLRELKARGFKMTRPEASRGLLEEYRQDNDPVRRFLKEQFKFDPKLPYPMETSLILKAYEVWAEREGIKGYLEVSALGKKITDLFPGAESSTEQSNLFKAKVKHRKYLLPTNPDILDEARKRIGRERDRRISRP